MRKNLIAIIMFFLLMPVLVMADAGKYIFEHIQTSHHWINDIFHDRDGFIWMSTRSGLYRYVGNGPQDFESVLEGECNDICQDKEGRIWVKKRNGYIVYDPFTATFKDEAQTAEMLGSMFGVTDFAVDEDGNFWWSADGGIFFTRRDGGEKMQLGAAEGQVYGIFCRNGVAYVMTHEGILYRYHLDSSGEVHSMPAIDVFRGEDNPELRLHSIFVDSAQNIWLSAGHLGIWFYPSGSTEPIVLTSDSKDNQIQTGFINSIEEDADGNIWLASDHGGISICDKSAQVIRLLRNDPADENTLASNGVYTVSRDNDGNIWVGYTKNGVSIYRGQNKTWSLSHIRLLHDNNLPDDINTACEDVKGNIWLGTDSHGLACVNPVTGREVLYNVSNSALRSNVITSVHCDGKGRVWIGTFYGGLSCIENGVMRTYSYREDGQGLSSDNIWSIDSDKSGRIWLGTLGGGIQVLDPEKDEFRTFRSADSVLSNDSVLELECADDGKIYVATSNGLTIFNPQTMSSEIIRDHEDMKQTILMGVTVDSDGLVWLDEDGVLQVYDPNTKTFYTPEHQALKAVRGVIEDRSGFMWVITADGLCRIRVYRKSGQECAFEYSSFSFPRIKDLQFNQRSVCMTSGGEFVIGSFSGYMRFAPDRYALEDTDKPMNLNFISLYVRNRLVKPGVEYGGRVILPNALEHTDRIVLNHDDSNISIVYSCLEYLSVREHDHFYRMEGLSDEWVTVPNNSDRLTFTNLSPGKYVLRMTSDTDDLTESISLAIRVRPPWWAAWWAVVMYVICAFAVANVSLFIYRRRKRMEEEQMEYSIKQERRHYVDEMKMQFFTNVSHDFRTPLTLILTPVEEKLAKNPELKNDPFISTIHRNAQRLLNLVNEVLDLRKMDMYGAELSRKSADLACTVKDTVSSFMLMAESQCVTLSMDLPSDPVVFDYDEGKIVKVLTNLLSNAFKFTPREGTIAVKLETDGENAVVTVSDTGQGVPDKDKRRIFDRFYQVKGSPTGSGIGLHVVREFIILHGGDITVEDNDPSGAVFRFTVPIHVSGQTDQDSLPEVPTNAPAASDASHPTVLVVDDNDDFRNFMTASLKEEYNVFEASDGLEALKIVEDEDIDVVISDVMMPNMDGTEFCRRMKSDINTSHIPVILLTAKAMQEDECYGLESGADDYLTKPFNMSILRLRIAKFIEWKKNSKRLFEKELEVTTEQITLTSMDDRLLQQAINIINENISNPDFSVSELSAALCMHRANLYKKLHYITGKTPVEFIRAIRLKKAAALLETDGVYISEVAYMVGFNSPKVFAGHFKEEFGCSPSEYRKKQINN